jgi:hypothetical protein
MQHSDSNALGNTPFKMRSHLPLHARREQPLAPSAAVTQHMIGGSEPTRLLDLRLLLRLKDRAVRARKSESCPAPAEAKTNTIAHLKLSFDPSRITLSPTRNAFRRPFERAPKSKAVCRGSGILRNS